MPNIGTLSVKSSFDESGIAAGVDKTIGHANRLKSSLDKTFESLKAGSASGALSSFGSMLSSPIGRVATMTAGVIGLGEAFRSLSSHAMEAASTQRSLQFQFGMSGQSAAAFSTWGRIAGLDSGSTVSAMQNVMRHFGEMRQAAAGGQETDATRALARLGLNMNEITSGDPATAIARIGDALKNVESPAERMALAHQVLGREWRELMPLLLQGTEGLATAQAHSHALSEEELRSLRAIRMEIAIAGQEMDHLATRAGGFFAMRWREITGTFSGQYVGGDPLGRDVTAIDTEIRRRQSQMQAATFGMGPPGSGGALSQTAIDDAKRIAQQEAEAQRQAELDRQQRDEQMRLRIIRENTPANPLQNIFAQGREINRLFHGAGADDQFERRRLLGGLFNRMLPSAGEAPLLGSLSREGADTAAILQGAAAPTVDRLAEINAVIDRMAEDAKENRAVVDRIAASADNIMNRLEEIWRDFFSQ